MKSGFITIAGKPNVGKSTLLNTLVGEKVAIVSWRPQTTRNKIIGIMHGEGYQAVFIDTPGIHKGKSALSQYMNRSVDSALEGVDGVVYVLAGDKNIDENDMSFIHKYASSSTPLIVAISKVDIADREHVGKIIEKLMDIKGIETIVPFSSRTNKNIDVLKDEIVSRLPLGDAHFEEDMITDKSVRFMCGEIIREKAMKFLSEEVPYGIGVNINKFDERKDGVIAIDADIVCEKKAHKPIIIGKGGAMLKKIGTAAREDIERLVDTKVFLTLWVRIKEEWREDVNLLNELGYNTKEL